MSPHAFWEEHKATILKILGLVVLIPLLIPVGMLLFTILSFITSAALLLVVVAILAGVVIMAWSLLDDYFRRDGDHADGDIEKTIIIESRRYHEHTDSTTPPNG
jgi:hypothetical protein